MLHYTEQGLIEAIVHQYRLFDGRTLYGGNPIAMGLSLNVVLGKVTRLCGGGRTMRVEATTMDARHVVVRIRRRGGLYTMEECNNGIFGSNELRHRPPAVDPYPGH